MGGGTYAINSLEILLFLLKIFTSQGNASSPPLLVSGFHIGMLSPTEHSGNRVEWVPILKKIGPALHEEEHCRDQGYLKGGHPPDEPPEAGQAQGSWRREFRLWMRIGPCMCFPNDPCWRRYEKNKYKEMHLPGLDLILPKVPTTFGGGLVMMVVTAV